MSRQIPLALRLRETPGLDDFVVGPNRLVIDALRRSLQPDGERQVFISGPRGSGRSHLLLASCSEAQARGAHCAYLPMRDAAQLSPRMLDDLDTLDRIAIDDIDAVAGDARWETALFDLYNRCRASGTALLFSAMRGPAALDIRLPDLRSRLAWGLSLALHPLRDDDRIALLQTLAGRRAMQLPDEVAGFLLDRTSRDPCDLVDTIDQLDRASLASQRRLTIPFVKQSLGL